MIDDENVSFEIFGFFYLTLKFNFVFFFLNFLTRISKMY